MRKFIKKHIETLLVGLLGLTIFACLNMLMLQMNPEVWTSTRFGAYTAFHKGWELSGFDNTTYIAVAEWRPLYVMMRHPLIMYFVWPMYQMADFLKGEFNVNCSIYVVAVFWTLISTAAWMLLYRIMRNIMELPVYVSLLLCLFYFSFSHVMLATFAPDHMILSMTIFLTMLYLSAKAAKAGKQTATWKSLLLCFLATGVSTTNCIKIWLIDMMSMQGKANILNASWWKRFICHGLLYFIPLALVGSLYWYQTDTIFAQEEGFSEKMDKRYSEKHPEKAAERKARTEKRDAENQAKQLVDSDLFQWTDVTIPILPSIVENLFGEGLQLHDEYTLRDSNWNEHRPSIVYYNHWYNYFVEAIIVSMLILGIWFGRKERLMWMVVSIFAFDCLLHLGFRFALNDVYIMTAHWAFLIPIAIGYCYIRLKSYPKTRIIMMITVALLATWLWLNNLTLTAKFILNLN